MRQSPDRDELLAERDRLKEETRRLRAVLDCLPDEVWYCDLAGRVSLLNQAEHKDIGRLLSRAETVDEIVRNVRILNPDGSPRPREDAPLLRSLAGEHLEGEEILEDPATGKRAVRHYATRPVYDEDGTLMGAVGSVRDVTERTALQDELRAAWAQADKRALERDLALDSLAEGVIFYDTNHMIVRMNPAAEAILGYSLEEINLAASDRIALFDLRSLDDEPLSREELAGFRALKGEHVVGEEFMIRPKHRDEPIVVLSSAAPIRSRDGAVLGVIQTIVDVTERERTLQALKRSEATFRRLAEADLVGVGVGDASGGVTYVNDEMLRMMGCTRDEFEAGEVNWNRCLAPEDKETTREMLREMEQTGRSRSREKTFVRPDGGLTPFLSAGALIPDTDEHVSVALDLTRIKQTERDLRASRTRLRRQNLALESINRIFQEVLACESEAEAAEICLQVAREVTASDLGLVGELTPHERLDVIAVSGLENPDISGARQLPLHGLYGRVADRGEAYYTNDPDGHPDSAGTPQGHPELESFLGVPLLKGGRVQGLICLANKPGGYDDFDLEAMRAVAAATRQALSSTRARRLVRESEEKFSRAFYASPGFMFVSRAEDGTLIEANRAYEELTGYSREELIGRTSIELGIIPPKVREEIRQTMRLTHGPVHMESTVTSKNGSARRVMYSLETIELDGVDCYICMGLDITHRVHMEAELRLAKQQAEKANRAKSEFLSNMSHEIRTPLNGIMGMIQLARLKTREEKTRQYLEHASTSADHLLDLINDVLDLSKIEAGKLEPEYAPLDVRETVKSSVEPFAAMARDKGIGLDLSIASGVPRTLSGDAGKLRQVLMNLVGNAVKFTEEGRVEVIVDAARHGDEALLKIKVGDTGIGIPEKRQEEIFESFEQVRTSHHVKYGGTGLGLTISRRLAEMMGGALSVSSRQGEGSVFTFTARLFLPAEKAQQPAERVGPICSGLRVLVAEDESVNRLVIEDLLKECGAEITLVGTGRQALDELAARHYDLVLMDIRMPEMDGDDALRRIRSGERGIDPKTPAVALTAHALAEEREKYMQAGFDAYLTKPLKFRDLERILGALEGGRAT